MKQIKIIGLTIVVLTIVIGFSLRLNDIRIAYLVASEVVILIALMRGIYLAQVDSKEETSEAEKNKEEK